MGSRFLVTDVQLGMIKGYTSLVDNKEGVQKSWKFMKSIINNILENQCVGISSNNINDDVKKTTSSKLFI
uniref:Uncharacterized protein n=1 Tax=viral metagenome TaxID=1070528 RepID=A0A6M3JGH0_9ZZZZ